MALKFDNSKCPMDGCGVPVPKDAELKALWTEYTDDYNVKGHKFSLTVLICPSCTKKIAKERNKRG